MTLKKANCLRTALSQKWLPLYLALTGVLVGASWGESSPSPRYVPLEIPWATVSKDSSSVLFTAYLTLPDSLGGRPIYQWLDTTQTPSATGLVWRKSKLRGDQATFLKATQALLKMDWLEAGQGHRLGLTQNSRSPLYPCFLANSALLLLAVGEKAEGEARLKNAAQKKGLAGDPARRTLVNLWLVLGEWSQADSVLDGMLLTDPEHPFAARAKSFLLRQNGKDSLYESFLKRQAIGRNAPPGLRKAYGALLLEKGRYHEAAQIFQRALDNDPKDGDAWVALGRAFMEQEFWIFAEEAFRHGLGVGTRDRAVFDLYAQVLLRCCIDGDRPNRDEVLAQAQGLLERGLALQLNNRNNARMLFDLYGLAGKFSAAEALRRNLWFHFEGPDTFVPSLGERNGFAEKHPRYLVNRLGPVTFPLFYTMQTQGHLSRN
jgi:tetratricopeptide (TPR) repeat protein